MVALKVQKNRRFLYRDSRLGFSMVGKLILLELINMDLCLRFAKV